MYKKRAAGHSIQSQLYETKLLSLILFRAQHNNDIEEFYMGSQVENAHQFDDICFKAKIKGNDQPLVVFMQVKHKENVKNSILSPIDIIQFFINYFNIQQSFNPRSSSIFFNECFDNTECLCIFYTNAKCDFKRDDLKSPFATHLAQLIDTSVVGGSQLSNAEEYLEMLETELLKHEIKILARQFAKYIFNKRNEIMMSDKYILRYHIILAQNVLHVSRSTLETHREHLEKYSTCTFRNDFFETSDKYLSLFKDELYQNVFENLKSKHNPTQTSHVHEFLSYQSEETLMNVMGSHITYKNNELKFIDNVSDDLKQKLSLINSRMSRSTINKTINTVTRKMLQSLEFKVPFPFGNTDLVVFGSTKKVEKRLDYLAQSIVNLIENSKPNYVVSIDETIPIGLLRLNGGLAGAVGNLLVCDNETGLLKFADDFSLLEPNAKCLLTKIKEKKCDLQNYRIQVNIMKFPKLTMHDHYNKHLVKKFLSKLMLWTEQASYEGLIQSLKYKIQKHEYYAHTDYLRIKSDAILLKYYDIIQNWWMSPETHYLTKERNLYQLAVEDISKNLIIQITSMIYMKKITSAEYSLKEEALDLFNSQFSKIKQTFVVTNITILTVTKVIQCLNKIKIYDPIVLDLKYVFNMVTNEYYALVSDLKKNELKQFLIVICDDLSTHPIFSIKLQNFILEVSDKEVVIIINDADRTMMRKSFPQISKVIYDDKNLNLEDIGASSQSQFRGLNATSDCLVDDLPMKMRQSVPEIPTIIFDRNHNMEDLKVSSQSKILNNAKASFQGKNVTLSDLVDGLPMKFIEGSVLRKIILNENIVIGGSLTNSNYDKHLFVDRKVIRDHVPLELHTLYDIKDDIVILTGKPGIGKSTLFTHLAVKSKKLNYKLWIVKINFLDCVKYFSRWHKHKTSVSTLEMLELMCHVVLQSIRPGCDAKISLQIEGNGDVCLLDLGVDDEWATFELRLFLHFYMKKNVIFLFDGFDEICPYYTETVVAFLKVFKDDFHKNKMWITSRLCKEINTLIESRFGKAYEIECFDENEVHVFLDKFWKTNLLLSSFDKERIEKLKEFLDTTELYLAKHSLTILNYPIGCVFISLILYLVTNFPDVNGRDKWRVLYETTSHSLKQMSAQEGESSESSENHLNIKTPLLAYLSAKYVSNYIKHSEVETYEKLCDKISLTNIYEQFVKTKLSNHFLNNKKVDINIPSIRMDYEEELQKLMKVYTNS